MTRATVLCIALALTLLAVACGGGSSKTTPAPTAAAAATSSLQTPLPLGLDTAAPTPEYTGSLRTGVWVRVETAADCLNFREFPASAGGRVDFCQPSGFAGYIAAGPAFEDGHWWWGIAGQGWAMGDFLTLYSHQSLNTRILRSLEGVGRIAFLAADGNSIWIMNSDGRERRKLADLRAGGNKGWVSDLKWAPDGGKVSFTATEFSPEGKTQETVRVINLDGGLDLEIPGAFGADWSPDGNKLAYIKGSRSGEILVDGVPTVMDLASRQTVAIGQVGHYSQGPAWRPDGTAVLFAGSAGIHIVSPDASTDKLVYPAGVMATWSPRGNMLSFYQSGEERNGFVVYDLARETVVRVTPWHTSERSGCGRDTVDEDFQTVWTPDESTLIFRSSCGVTGDNGIWLVNVQSGRRDLIPVWEAWSLDMASDGTHLAYSTGGGTSGRWTETIWVSDLEGSPPVGLAEGWMPVWQPQPR